jgi:hypothetical protein
MAAMTTSQNLFICGFPHFPGIVPCRAYGTFGETLKDWIQKPRQFEKPVESRVCGVYPAQR